MRVVGVDDGSFRRDDRWAPVAAVAVAAPDRVETIRLGRVRVDGRDATTEVLRLVRATGGLESLHAVLLDGAVVGGFNVLDLDRLHRRLGVPIVAITRTRPEFPAIRAALTKWFPRDGSRRYELLRRHRLTPMPRPGPPLFLTAIGCRRVDAAQLIRRTVVRGHVPEPLRIAHLVASAAGSWSAEPNRRIMGPGARRPSGL